MNTETLKQIVWEIEYARIDILDFMEKRFKILKLRIRDLDKEEINKIYKGKGGSK